MSVTTLNRNSDRLFFLDNLRAFIILLVVVFHVSYPYSKYFSQGWYVTDTQQSLFFDVYILGLYAFMMPVIFFISGYFGIRSLASKGLWAFWKDKLLRIVTPWAAGVLLLAPAMAYLQYVAVNRYPVYLKYWAHYFFGRDYMIRGQGPLYFLGVLTLFYIVLSIAYLLYKPLGEIKANPTKKLGGWLLLFGLATGAALFCGNLLVDEGRFAKIGILDFPATRMIPYLCYFFLGVFAYKQQWFTPAGYIPKPRWWARSAVLFFILFTTFTRKGMMPETYRMVCYAFSYYFFCLSATFTLLASFRRRMNFTTPFLGSLSANSYGIYFIHMMVGLPVIITFLGLKLNVFIKYPIVAVLSVVGSYLLSQFVLSGIPVFGSPVKRSKAEDGIRGIS